LQQVDPVNLTTVFGSNSSTSSINSISVNVISLQTNGGAVKLSWTVTGAGASFTGLNTSISQRPESPGDLKVGGIAVSSGNPVPISDAGGSLTVDGTVSISTPDKIDSGTIAANGQNVTTLALDGVGSFAVQITGTWAGTIQFEGSVDGTNYVSVNARTSNSGVVGVSTTANGVFRVARPGYQLFRCRSSAWTSGTATITVRQAMASGAVILSEAIPTGANVIGGVTGSGNFNIVGPGAVGAAISGNPVRIGISDGTNTRNVLGDTSGRSIVVGAAASGAAVAGNPVLIGGSDGTNARSLRTATDGTLRTDPTGTTAQPVTDAGGSLTVDTSQLPAALVGGRLDVVVGAALPAGTNNIGGVDILSVPTSLSTTGGGTEATALRVTVASDSTGVLSVDDNGGSLTVDGTVTSNQGTAAAATAPWAVRQSDGTAFISPSLEHVTAGSPHATRLTDGSSFYDARSIRALTNADIVTVEQGAAAAATAPWSVRVSDGTSFVNPALEHITAGSPHAARLTDGSTFYKTNSDTQLPSSLVGGRLDSNIGTWLGSTAPTVGSKTSANSVPVVIASDQGAIPVSGTVTASNPSVGTNASAIPTSSTQVGGSDGTNLQAARVFDADSGAGTQFVLGTILRKSASGGSVEAGTSADPLRTDPTGTTTQPISAASLPLPSGAATETTLGTRLSDATFTNRINTLGQKTSTNSTPVVLASDQSTVPVSGTVTANIGTTNGLALDATLTAQSLVDNAAFTDGTTRVQPAGYIFDEVAGTALTENDAAAARIDNKRAQIQVIEDGTTRVVAISPNNTVAATQSGSWTNDVTDRAVRQVGVVYGSQGQQIRQTATNFNLQAELAVGGTLIDPRSIRALTNADVVSAQQSGTWTVTQGTAAAATAPWATRLSDGTAFYKTNSDTQLPAALVGGRLDNNIGAWFGSTAPTVGSKTSANSIPVVIASDQTLTITGTNDVSDRAARLLGVVYGSQGQQLRQTATNFNLQVELATGGTLYDSRQIRALTNADVVSAQQSGTWTVTQGTAAAATAPWAARLSDGTAFYTAPNSGQLPAALVGSRLDINNGSWLGSTSPTVGQKTMADSIPVVIGSDQTVIPVSDNGGSLTVDGTLTANIGTTNGLALDATLTAQSLVDNAAFTDGTTRVIPAGYVFDEVAGTALTENDAAVARIDNKRAQVMVIEDGSSRGTRTTIKPSSTAPVVGDTALVVVLSPNQGPLAVTTSPSTAATGIAFGDPTLAAIAQAPVRRTTYTEPAANFQGSIVSANAADSAAGTGARTVRIYYMDSTGTTTGTEDVTLNGTTNVNLVTTTKCFIDKIEVLTAGSGGVSAGIITLRTGLAGGGAIVGTMAAGDTTTHWAHHYVVSGKVCNVTGTLIASNSTVAGNGSVFVLRAKPIGVANAVEKQVSDFMTLFGQSSHVTRVYNSQIRVSGPARILMYVTPVSGTSVVFRGSFDYYDE
jgi:uncharacterized membrane protein